MESTAMFSSRHRHRPQLLADRRQPRRVEVRSASRARLQPTLTVVKTRGSEPRPRHLLLLHRQGRNPHRPPRGRPRPRCIPGEEGPRSQAIQMTGGWPLWVHEGDRFLGRHDSIREGPVVVAHRARAGQSPARAETPPPRRAATERRRCTSPGPPQNVSRRRAFPGFSGELAGATGVLAGQALDHSLLLVRNREWSGHFSAVLAPVFGDRNFRQQLPWRSGGQDG